MTFSIIVPVYNVERYLDDCVASILNQSFEDFELILVDDGSTDKSAQLCDRYQNQDSRVRTIHKENGGLVSARRAGVEGAKGDYAVCVDGDDWIALNHLQELKKIIDEYSPDIICFNWYEVKDNRAILKNNVFRKGYYSKIDIENEIYPHLIQTNSGTAFPPSIWAKAYRMELYRREQLEVDNKIKIAEDVACTVPCLVKARSMYNLDKALYYYRRNDHSMTKVKQPISWDGPELIENHLRKRLKEVLPLFEEQIERRTIHALINVIRTQFYTSKPYFIVTRNVKRELRRANYSRAITSSKFNHSWTFELLLLCMRHGIMLPFYLLGRIH